MKCHPFDKCLVASALFAASGLPSHAQNLIFSDNFNIADTASLDGSNQIGRHEGLAASEVVLRSGGVQHTISNNQLNILPGGSAFGRVRFQNAASLPANVLFNFASGASGTEIDNGGGLRIEFDWTPPNNTTDDWVSLNVGINYLDTTVGVVHASTDFGVIFRNNGNTQVFDNGVAGSTGTFGVSTVAQHHAIIDLTFDSFADGTTVTADIRVDNVAVGAPVTFTWSGNAGALNLEMAGNNITKQVDNIAISSLPAGPDGDTDDDLLPDEWELSFAGNLTGLTGQLFGPGPGAGTGDFDGDGISDLDEYNYGNGLFPGISPVKDDSDNDTLKDPDEIFGGEFRPATSPVRADTDRDGLSDLVETNTGTFIGSSDSGSNPTLPDTDFDGSRDGFEVSKGSNPLDNVSRPAVPVGFSLVQLTDDASTGLSTGKTYTHLVSGNQSVSVNGVTFQKLDLLVTPSNFTWTEVGAGNKDVILNNQNSWIPANGGVTGAGLIDLLDSFVYTTGGSPGQYQTYTLSGLTPGETYQVKLYVRTWDKTGGSGRPLDLTFTNGATVKVPFGGLKEDRPGTVLNNGNEDSAYYLSYTYVAETTELTIKAEVHESSVDTPTSASGNFHLYALSNEVVPPPSGDLVVTSVARNASGEILIGFRGAASTTYKVTKSADLKVPFGPLTVPLTATTDAGGAGDVVVPASEASGLTGFYRVENQ